VDGPAAVIVNGAWCSCKEDLVTHHQWVTPIGEIPPRFVFSRQLATPCSHLIALSLMCYYSLPHWASHCVPSLICDDCMFEGGRSNPEGMAFHYVIGCLCLLFLGTFGHGLVGGFCKKKGLWLYSCSLTSIWGLIWYPSRMGSPLLAISFRSDTTWETLILATWSHFSLPYISLPFAHYKPFSHLGPYLSTGSTRC